MKASQKILTTCLVVGALAVGITTYNVSATENPDTAVANSVNAYVDGLKTGNIDKMLSYVKDTRANDTTTLRANYERYIKMNQARHTQIRVLGIQKVDANDYKVNLEMSSDLYQPADFSLPVINDNGTWKVFVDGKVMIKSPAK